MILNKQNKETDINFTKGLPALAENTKLDGMAQNLEKLRTQLYEACRTTGATATGAWCLIQKGRKEIAPGYPMAQHHVIADSGVAEVLSSLFAQNVHVLDLGCGIGQYGHYFAKHRKDLHWE